MYSQKIYFWKDNNLCGYLWRMNSEIKLRKVFTFYHVVYFLRDELNRIFIILFYLFFIFGHAGSLLLCRLFFSCSRWRVLSSCNVQASQIGSFSCAAQALGHTGFSSCGRGLSSYSSWALERRLNSFGTGGLVALWHVRFSWIRDKTHVSCIGRWILYHWATWEALILHFHS